jgi:hypothetical protein
VRQTRVLVFGTGPAGLLAVHTAVAMGCSVQVWGEGVYSRLYGAQFLHVQPEGLRRLDSSSIAYSLLGTAQQYREKVYGSEAGYGVKVSPEVFSGPMIAYDIRQAYRMLWDMYAGACVIEKVQNGRHFEDLIVDISPDVVVSTIPASKMCIEESHAFISEEVWAIGDAPDLGIRCPIRVNEDNVVCNGLPEPAWYRASSIFGHCTVEWPGRSRPPYPDVASVVKPLRTNCDCFPTVVRGGRYGEWSKGVLSHHIIDKVRQAIRNA